MTIGNCSLNRRTLAQFEAMCAEARELRIELHELDCGAKLLDCGVHVPGGLQAGLEFSRICLANRARVQLEMGPVQVWPGDWVRVESDHPVEACMLGQYAGWPVQREKFFAMGSGPMRLRRGREELLKSLGASDSDSIAVGTLECDTLPSDEVMLQMAEECEVEPINLCVAVAPTRSICGCIQVVARSVETCLHKLHELGFPLASIVSATGVAPLCPPTPDFAKGIGRTNDAILYGAHVRLWVDASDEQIEELGPRVPSCSSTDFGSPFADIFQRYEFDFYKVDPGLFSPAQVTLMNLRSGRSWCFGQLRSDLVAQSFGTVGSTQS